MKSECSISSSKTKFYSLTKPHCTITVCLCSHLPGAAASWPRPSVHGAGLWSTGLWLERETCAWGCTHSLLHQQNYGAMFCARSTNHKQSLMINSVPSACMVAHSWLQPVTLLQQKSVLSNTTNRTKTLMNIYTCVFIYLTLMGTLDIYTEYF